MTRGKYAARSANRQAAEAAQTEAQRLAATLARTERERDELAEKLQKTQEAAATERRALLADIDAGASRRTAQLEEQLARREEELRKSEAQLADVREGYGKIMDWWMDHLIEHGMKWADGLELMLRVVGRPSEGNCIAAVGLANIKPLSPEKPHSPRETEVIMAIQRARGIRA